MRLNGTGLDNAQSLTPSLSFKEILFRQHAVERLAIDRPAEQITPHDITLVFGKKLPLFRGIDACCTATSVTPLQMTLTVTPSSMPNTSAAHP